MKLAEALILRADLKKRMEQLRERVKNSAKVQEGDEPAENVEELGKELDAVFSQLEDLIYRINVTNIQTVCGGENLTHMLSKKDVLMARLTVLRDIANHIGSTAPRYSRSEIKYVRTIDYAQFRKEVDKYSKELRELDTKIQALNWNVDLLEA